MVYGSSPLLVFSFICLQRFNKQGIMRRDKTNRHYAIPDIQINIVYLTDIVHLRQTR